MTSASGDVQTKSTNVFCQPELSTGSLDPVDYLPNEILSKVLRFLAAEDLCHLAECNKAWRNVTNTDSLWLRLCKLRDWERFDTEVDLRKEKTIQASETSTSGSDPTFPADSVITDDCNLKDLAPTCEWKEVHMRAWHLNRNWSEGRYRERRVETSTNSLSFVTDGRTLATYMYTDTCAVQFSDLSTGNILHEIKGDVGHLIIKHNIGVAAFKGGVLVFDARTGKELKLIRGTVVDFDERVPCDVSLEEDKIIVFYMPVHTGPARDEEDVFALIWDISGLVEGGNDVQCTETKLRIDGFNDITTAGMDYLACQGHFLLSTCDDKTAFILWDTRMSEYVRMYRGHSGEVKCSHLHGNTIMTGDCMNEIKVWSVDSDACLKTLSTLCSDPREWPGQGAWKILFNDNGIAAVVDDGFGRENVLRFWNRDGSALPGAHIERLQEYGWQCKMHGNRLIATPISDQFSVWEVSTGKRNWNRKLPGLNVLLAILHIDDTKIVLQDHSDSKRNLLILQFW